MLELHHLDARPEQRGGGAFEEAFEIDIPDEDAEKIRTVQDAVDYIEKNAKK